MDNKDDFGFSTDNQNGNRNANNTPVNDDMDLFATFAPKGSQSAAAGAVEQPDAADTAESADEAARRATQELEKPRVSEQDTIAFNLTEFKDSAETSGKKSTDKKKRKAKRVKQPEEEVEYVEEKFSKRLFRYLGNLAIAVCCLCVIIGCLVATLMAVYVVNITADDGDLLSENKLELGYTTILYYQDETTGEYLESARLFGSENRIWVNINDIPEHVQEAVIAIEDNTFLTHHGVNWKRTFAAFINEYLVDILPGTQGGSTLTQQLVKNITDDKATDSFSGALRKLREIYRAISIENVHTKEEIMEAYLNTFRLSGQLAGVEAGANAYFACTTSELSVAQAAALICVTNAPSYYNPLVNPDNNKERRELVIKLMYDQGFLTDEEYADAMEESATLAFVNTVDENGNLIITDTVTVANTIQSYFTDMVINDVISDLMTEYGMTRTEATKYFYNGGLRVYTTMNKKCQDYYDKLTTDSIWPTTTDKNGNRQQAAMITINMTGEIVGVMGGVGEKTGNRVLNRAVDSLRQVGSTMKPIGVYGPAIEIDAVHYSTVIQDEPIQIRVNGKITTFPVNFSRKYGSPQTIQKAIEQSTNTIAVKTLQIIGFDYSYGYLTSRLGISTLTPGDKTYSSLALGGMTYGLRIKELVAAYVPFANGGTYYEPHCYTKVTDAAGKTILNKARDVTQIKAFSSETAMIMNRLLQTVITSGSGQAAQHGKLPLGGKSGTTSNDYDYTFIAFNPYYVTGTWMGYDESYKLSSKVTSRKSVAAVLNNISSYLPYKTFPTSSGVVALTYCKVSGELASSACTETAIGYYKSSNVPGYCYHDYYSSDSEIVYGDDD